MSWLDKEFEIDYAPWCRPRPRTVAPGVTVTTTYGYHALAALLYLLWKQLGRWAQLALNRPTRPW